MGEIVIAWKNVKACIALPRSQKKKRKIIEHECQQKNQYKIGLKVFEIFWEMNFKRIGR